MILDMTFPSFFKKIYINNILHQYICWLREMAKQKSSRSFQEKQKGTVFLDEHYFIFCCVNRLKWAAGLIAVAFPET